MIDWYPKIQALASLRGQSRSDITIPDENHFEDKHLAFMDIDKIFFNLLQYKNEKAWYNLNLSKANIIKILKDTSWYILLIPNEEMEFRSFDQVHRWQEIAVSLLKKYCDKYYKFRKEQFEKDHLEYKTLSEQDDNFIEEYHLLIDQSRRDIIAKLEELKQIIENGQLKKFEYNGFVSIMFNRHLYQTFNLLQGAVLLK